MVLARDQVRITRFSPAAFIVSIFFKSLGSINGPFFKERVIGQSPFFPYRLLFRRLRTIYCSVRLLVRVLAPKAGLPQGVLGAAIPTGDRPSPPPCGWLLGS